LEEKHLSQTSIEEELRAVIKERNKRIEEKSEEVSVVTAYLRMRLLYCLAFFEVITLVGRSKVKRNEVP